MSRKCKVYIGMVLMGLIIIGAVNRVIEYRISGNIETCLEKFGLEDGYDNISIVKSHNGRLSKKKTYNIIHSLLQGVGGEIIKINKWDDKICVYGYSPFLNNSVKYEGKIVNMNIILTYMNDMDVTHIYVASPMVNIDY